MRLIRLLENDSADQLAQPVSLTTPGVPIMVEFVTDQRADLEQTVDLRLHLSPVPLRSVALHRHVPFDGRDGAVVGRFRGKYLVKLGGVDLVVAGVGPGR